MSAQEILADLIAEQAALDTVVAALNPDQWQLATPSDRWTIADQIGHLTYFDNTAALALEDPPGFVAHRAEIVRQLTDSQSADDYTLSEFRSLDATGQLEAWRVGRARLAAAAAELDKRAGDDRVRVEWYGPSMSLNSFLTARLMETWAHGQDIVDTLAADDDAAAALRGDTDRLRHIAQLGVITRGWSYVVRGATPPDGEIRVELTAPSGEAWSWGPDDADQRISGSAVDFCRVVTQRRNIADTALVVVGDDAQEWMRRPQAFAGAATPPPAPRSATQH